jgi:hypothetical protein
LKVFVAKGSGPKSKFKPTGPHIRQTADPDAWHSEPVCLLFSSFDIDGPWGKIAFSECDWREVAEKLEGFQSMTWAEILRATGSVSYGNNNHHIDFDKLSSAAQTRLNDLQREDIDTVFSFHLRGKLRVYGIRDRKHCRILWLDPWHDAARGVCPSSKK